jgi:hypothetical protein
LAIIISKDSVPIRLNEERWFHIVENHDDLAGLFDEVLSALEEPDLIIRGYRGALIAIKGFSKARYLAVVCREISKNDGFVITAYFTTKYNKEQIVWKRHH